MSTEAEAKLDRLLEILEKLTEDLEVLRPLLDKYKRAQQAGSFLSNRRKVNG